MRKPVLKDYDTSKWYIATAVGCLACPVGYVWLIVNTVIEFRKHIRKNRAILYSGLGAAIFSLTYFIIFSMTSDEDDFLMGLSFMWLPQAIMAVYLFIVYAIHARRSRKLSACLMLIKDDHITSTEELADILGVRESGVNRLAASLIRKGFLEGAEIDKAQHEIIFRKSVWAKQKAVCRYCGASLIVDYGHTLICEYCGQALSVESNNRTERA
ncbi:MAG: hypothetical protein IJK64_09590 [Clostridia bacterium]|nr:hypothetical protein [Clostridia bacterium]